MKKSLISMLIATAVILGLGLIGGAGLGITLSGAVSESDGFYMDGSDLTSIVQAVGYLGSFAIAVFVFMYSAVLALAVWAVYGIVLLFIWLYRKSRKAFAVAAAVIAGVPLIFCGVNAAANYMPVAQGSIASVAYNHDPASGSRIYIKENGVYTPYLVLDKNYMGTKNTLFLRENIIGGKGGYVEDYNGGMDKEKIYDGQMTFDDAERFLNEEFPQRFEEAFLNAVCDTKLEFYDVYNEADETVTEQKFFMLSGVELGYYEKSEDTYRANDGTGNNGRPLKYFEENNKTAANDIGEEIPYWTRSKHYGKNCAVGYSDGWIDFMDGGVRYGVRPAFAIPADTRIKRAEADGLGEIWVLDLE